MCLMEVFAASVQAFVTRLVMNTSMADHHTVRVAQSRSVSGVSAAATQPARFCRAVSASVYQDQPEAFLHAPRGAQLAGGVIAGEHLVEPVPG